MKAPKRLRPRPVVFVWDGDSMIPLPRFKRLCDQQFAVHEEYPLVILEERSQASHNHYFAALTEAWRNLAEEHAVKYPTVEHLRADCLVKAGFCQETDYVLADKKEARKLAVDLRKMNPYSIIKVSDNVVKHFEPESQSRPAMKKDRFEDSKAEVLSIAAAMARTTPAELKKNAGRAA